MKKSFVEAVQEQNEAFGKTRDERWLKIQPSVPGFDKKAFLMAQASMYRETIWTCLSECENLDGSSGGGESDVVYEQFLKTLGELASFNYSEGDSGDSSGFVPELSKEEPLVYYQGSFFLLTKAIEEIISIYHLMVHRDQKTVDLNELTQDFTKQRDIVVNELKKTHEGREYLLREKQSWEKEGPVDIFFQEEMQGLEKEQKEYRGREILKNGQALIEGFVFGKVEDDEGWDIINPDRKFSDYTKGFDEFTIMIGKLSEFFPAEEIPALLEEERFLVLRDEVVGRLAKEEKGKEFLLDYLRGNLGKRPETAYLCERVLLEDVPGMAELHHERLSECLKAEDHVRGFLDTWRTSPELLRMVALSFDLSDKDAEARVGAIAMHLAYDRKEPEARAAAAELFFKLCRGSDYKDTEYFFELHRLAYDEHYNDKDALLYLVVAGETVQDLTDEGVENYDGVVQQGNLETIKFQKKDSDYQKTCDLARRILAESGGDTPEARMTRINLDCVRRQVEKKTSWLSGKKWPEFPKDGVGRRFSDFLAEDRVDLLVGLSKDLDRPLDFVEYYNKAWKVAKNRPILLRVRDGVKPGLARVFDIDESVDEGVDEGGLVIDEEVGKGEGPMLSGVSKDKVVVPAERVRRPKGSEAPKKFEGHDI